jgi:hypothetical protein
MPSPQRVIVEISVLFALAVAFVVIFRSRANYVNPGLAVIAVGLIAWTARESKSIWRHARERAAGGAPEHGGAFRQIVLFTFAALALLSLAGVSVAYHASGWRGAEARFANWHILPAAAVYLPWAFLQQYIFEFYLLGRLLYLAPAPVALGGVAMAFCVVHYPRIPVMAVTAVAGLVWAAHYRRFGNLLPLALSHALLGSALQYWVFGRDLLNLWHLAPP